MRVYTTLANLCTKIEFKSIESFELSSLGTSYIVIQEQLDDPRMKIRCVVVPLPAARCQ